MTTVRFATHNQADKAASPTSGWDVQCLTERSKSPQPEKYDRYAPGIKGLAIDWDPDVFDVRRKFSTVVHPGAAKITPTRGTIWVTGRLTEAPDVRVAVVCSHRINDPSGSKRLGGAFRRIVWQSHALFDRRLFKSLESRGYLVLYGGDINDRRAGLTPLVRELHGHYDAIGYTRSKGLRLVGKIAADRSIYSDHARFTATFDIKEK